MKKDGTSDQMTLSIDQKLDHNTTTAIVLCAGLGTRLRPLTQVISKVAVPLGGMPLAFHCIRQFLDEGIQQVHCNTHYLAEGVEHELRAAAINFGYGSDRLRFWREDQLLNTGGGIFRILETLQKENQANETGQTVVVSGDILGALPLTQMRMAWKDRNANETSLMVTMPLESARKDAAWLSKDGRHIIGFGDPAMAPEGAQMRLFSNYQILSNKVVLREGPEPISSIDLFYRKAIPRCECILHVPHPPDHAWHNVGTYAEYAQASEEIKSDQGRKGRIKGDPLKDELPSVERSNTTSAKSCLVLINQIDDRVTSVGNAKEGETSINAPLSNTLVEVTVDSFCQGFPQVYFLQETLEKAFLPGQLGALKKVLETLRNPTFLASDHPLPEPRLQVGDESETLLSLPHQETLLSQLHMQISSSICIGARSAHLWNGRLPLLVPFEAFLEAPHSESIPKPVLNNLLQYSYSGLCPSRTYLYLIPESQKR